MGLSKPSRPTDAGAFVIWRGAVLTIQTLADIAMRHATYVSAAMIVACVRRHYRTGEPLELGPRVEYPRDIDAVAMAEIPQGEWRRMVERNSDTRWQHV